VTKQPLLLSKIRVSERRRGTFKWGLLSQIAQHAAYGGVVPEIAARAHIETLSKLITRALSAAKIDIHAIDAIAAACGPGLIGGVLVGMTAGKAIALAANKPFIAINHLEAHALTARLFEDLDFPFAALLISGGHMLRISCG